MLYIRFLLDPDEQWRLFSEYLEDASAEDEEEFAMDLAGKKMTSAFLLLVLQVLRVCARVYMYFVCACAYVFF